jgi:hypothetical protein
MHGATPTPPTGTPGAAGVATTAAARADGRICLLLPDGGGALWLKPGAEVLAVVQRIASGHGVTASDLALTTGGGRVRAKERATGCSGQLVVLRLAWRARGGGCGASTQVAVESGPKPQRPRVPKAKVQDEATGKKKKKKQMDDPEEEIKGAMRNRKKFGGTELEAVIQSGAAAMLSARWLIKIAKRDGSVLKPR